MTDDERKQIVDEVLFAIRKNSKEIDQLPTAENFTEIDNIEVSRGRKVSARFLAESMFKFVFDEYLKNHYLSSDKDDTAKGHISFDKGLSVGDFVDSMFQGRGTGILPDGRIQTDRLEVRGSMTVMDLIINEIHAMAGEYNFSDCGKIESVQVVNSYTFKLFMEKETETDVVKFEENDVLLSIVNNLRVGGTDYHSSWMRCLSKNVNENSITVVLFPDSEVPGGKNYPPVAKYNVTRRGNARIPAEGDINPRSQSWYLSTKEGRILFLTNVFKPIIEEYNYALSLGSLPDVKALRNIGVVGDVGLYAQTIACEKLYEIDWNGDLIPRKVDRGPWSEQVAQSNLPYRYVAHENVYPDGKKYTELEQHTVWHHGCKWGCLIDKTTEEPVWNSRSWAMIEGDPSYYLDFDSSNGWQFRIGAVDTIITASVTHANRDITNVLMASQGTSVEWFRDTGDPISDAAWKPTILGENANIIQLSDIDMGAGWGSVYKAVNFTCKVYIPDGEGDFETAENSINIKI